jgi:hypothetical protein
VQHNTNYIQTTYDVAAALDLSAVSAYTQDEIIDLDQVQLQGATAAAAGDAEVRGSVSCSLVARRYKTHQ